MKGWILAGFWGWIFLFPLYAQTPSSVAELRIEVRSYVPENSNRYSYSIFNGDTLISLTPIVSPKNFSKSHYLKCGVYKVEVYRNDSLHQSFHHVDVECGERRVFNIYLEQNISYKLHPDPFDPVDIDTSGYFGSNEPNFGSIVTFSTGTRLLENTNDPIAYSLYLASGGDELWPMGKHFGMGFMGQLEFGFTHAKKDTFLHTMIRYPRERYSSITLDFGYYIRLSTFNLKFATERGFFLDLGCMYQFPLLFRHVGIEGNEKNITRNIHAFNQLTPFVRLGRRVFRLYAGYRVLDYIRGPFPQNPRLTLGLQVHFGDDGPEYYSKF